MNNTTIKDFNWTDDYIFPPDQEIENVIRSVTEALLFTHNWSLSEIGKQGIMLELQPPPNLQVKVLELLDELVQASKKEALSV